MYPDVFFTGEYQELFKDTAFGGKPEALYAFDIDFRFYKRPIEGTPYFDIVSPYGYSGPVVIGTRPDWDNFSEAFAQYCKEENVIADFIRLHPFETNRLQTYHAARYEHEIYYIDLTQTEEQIWDGFDKGCKSSCKKLKEFDITPGVPKYFVSLYSERMKQIGADEYLFDDSFFKKLSKEDFAFTFLAEGAGILLLVKGKYCHYFLSGSLKGNLTNGLLYKAIIWAKGAGYQIFNLGGGLRAGDSLEHFKQSFTHTSRPFFTFREICNEKVYNELCGEWGIDPHSEGFFPAYRR